MRTVELKFRLIKIQKQDGSWKKYKIKSCQELKKILKNPYKNAYWSVSEYLTPLKIEHPSYNYQKTILNSFIFIETDCEKPYTEISKAIELMKKRDYELIYLFHSGGGIHSYWSHKTRNFKEEKKEVSDYLRKYNLNIDYPVLEDIHRIARIFNSFNGNKNCETKLLSLNQLRRGVENESSMTDKSTSLIHGREAIRPKPLPTNGEYISTKVKGSKFNQVLFLKYDNLKKAKRDIKKLNLKADCYLFDFDGFIGVITMKCYHINKIRKIARKSRAKNKKSILKFRYQYIRISPLFISSGEISQKKPVYMGKIKYFKNSPYFASKSHIPFMGQNKVDLKDEYENLLIGEMDNKVYLCKWS